MSETLRTLKAAEVHALPVGLPVVVTGRAVLRRHRPGIYLATGGELRGAPWECLAVGYRRVRTIGDAYLHLVRVRRGPDAPEMLCFPEQVATRVPDRGEVGRFLLWSPEQGSGISLDLDAREIRSLPVYVPLDGFDPVAPRPLGSTVEHVYAGTRFAIYGTSPGAEIETFHGPEGDILSRSCPRCSAPSGRVCDPSGRICVERFAQ